MKLETFDMNLKVLRVGYFDGYASFPVGSKVTPRTCYDYELEYYEKSDGGILCDGKKLPMHAGDVNVRKPGQRVQGVMPYRCYIICLHLTGGKATSDYVFGSPNQAQPCYRNELLDSLPERLRVKDTPYIAKLFEQIYISFHQTNDLAVFQTQQHLYELLGALFEQTSSKEKLVNYVNPHVMQAAQKIRRSFTEPFNVGQMIEDSGLSRAYFHKCFKLYTGHTPTKLLLLLRMERAKELLCLTDLPIAEVAMECGYNDPVYFSHLFRRQVGQTPSAYRQSRQTP